MSPSHVISEVRGPHEASKAMCDGEVWW